MKFWYFSVKIQYLCTVRYGTVPMHRNKPAIRPTYLDPSSNEWVQKVRQYVEQVLITWMELPILEQIKVHDISQTNVSPRHRSGDELSKNNKLYELA